MSAASDPKFRAIRVRSPRGARVTEIDWADGHKGILPHEILRGYCPCAGCQGHSGTIKFLPPSQNQLEIDALEPVGNYALKIVWFDGHDNGLYSFKYLRALCQCDACVAADAKDARGERERL
jgi:DUF971 family protein